ncbi:MAG: hypothetical protein OXC26_00460 [Albidovulum sp.]|nr:hypothetical protein [Albidovulum sp.]
MQAGSQQHEQQQAERGHERFEALPRRGREAQAGQAARPGRQDATAQDDPDRVESDYPSRCGLCGGGLERERSVSYAVR